MEHGHYDIILESEDKIFTRTRWAESEGFRGEVQRLTRYGLQLGERQDKADYQQPLTDRKGAESRRGYSD